MLNSATVDRIRDLLAAGATNRAVAAECNIGKDTAARYRALLGYGPAPKRPHPTRTTLTVEQKWQQHARPVAGGHVEWTGRHRADTGTPVFTHLSREYTARSVAWRVATGRPAVGKVTAECDQPDWCIAPEHVADEPARTKLREALAIVQGKASPLTECTRGHDTSHRRYDRNGRPYCATCHAGAAAIRKAVA